MTVTSRDTINEKVSTMAKSDSNHTIARRCALVGTLSLSLIAISGAEAAQRPATKTFKVGSQSFEGRPETICVIEGKWADGGHFRYQAWDTCDKMRLRAVSARDYKDAPSLGSEAHYSVADIPSGSEVLEISNDFSTTLVFRDLHGEQREILTRD